MCLKLDITYTEAAHGKTRSRSSSMNGILHNALSNSMIRSPDSCNNTNPSTQTPQHKPLKNEPTFRSGPWQGNFSLPSTAATASNLGQLHKL